ncbi:MAG: hypothetical protein ACT452_13340 [Microthrixaceae bacterium]
MAPEKIWSVAGTGWTLLFADGTQGTADVFILQTGAVGAIFTRSQLPEDLGDAGMYVNAPGNPDAMYSVEVLNSQAGADGHLLQVRVPPKQD